MAEFQAGPYICNSAIGISSASGDYNCSVTDLDQVMVMTHHMSMVFQKKHAKICNSLAFTSGATGHPDTDGEGVVFSWTEDCSNGSCAVEISMKFPVKA
jgi:hypothetical protein